MKLIDLTCSKCGATLQVNPELTKCMCQYCGNEMLVDDEVVHHQVDNGFDIGYQAELGRQQAIQDLANQREIEKQKALEELATRIETEKQADRQRLLSTPRGQYYWKLLAIARKRAVGDIEAEQIIRQQLVNDIQLRYEYQNGIVYTNEMCEAEKKEIERKTQIEIKLIVGVIIGVAFACIIVVILSIFGILNH